MGKSIFKLNWLAVAVIFAFVLSGINTFMLKQKKDVKTLDGLAKNEDIKKEVDSYLQIIKQKVSFPEQYGCDYIAVKGSVYGNNMKDVTEQVIKDVK